MNRNIAKCKLTYPEMQNNICILNQCIADEEANAKL